MSLQTRIAESLRSFNALERGSSYLVACSGGIDSTVLAHCMQHIRRAWSVPLTLAYIHHGLRPEADDEQQWVADFAKKHELGFATRAIDVKGFAEREKRSIHDAGHELRYAALEEMREEAHADWILTAHHADDQAETILLHLLRGAGLEGLSGIPPVNGRVVRPLLFASRSEIETYARENELSWKSDSSNRQDKYTRNALRLHVMPLLKRYINPGLVGTLQNTAELFTLAAGYCNRTADRLVERYAQSRQNEYAFPLDALRDLHPFERLLVFRRLAELSVGIKPGYEASKRIERLSENQAGTMELFETFRVVREREYLTFSRANTKPAEELAVSLGEKTENDGFLFESAPVPRDEIRFVSQPGIEYIDLFPAGTQWTLRPWRSGDYFYPFGAGFRKKVSDYLTEIRASAGKKKSYMVLERDGDIIWLCGMRLDDRFKITDATETAARLRFDYRKE